MLVVRQLDNNTLSVKAHYYYKKYLYNITGAYFNYDSKEWMVPITSLDELEKTFHGELVYKTPRWVIKKEPMPDLSSMYVINDKSIQAPQLKCKLYDYQDYGVRFMIDKLNQFNFIINADDVGLGKTIQSIATLQWFVNNKGVSKVLIICKRSIRTQWKSEINKFTDLGNDFTINIAAGTPKQRKQAYQDFDTSAKSILITNYHTFLNDNDIIKDCDIDFVIIDEVHSIKARTGKLNNSIAKVVRGKPIVFLTGTPIMSKPEDIFGIVQIATPKYFGKWSTFSNNYLRIASGIYGVQVVGAKNLDELRNKVQDIVIRRTEYEVSLALPDTNIIRVDCPMDTTQETLLKIIKEYQDRYQMELDKLKINSEIPPENKDKADKIEAQSKALIAARQAASTDPRLFMLSNSKMMRTNFGCFVSKTYKMSSKTEAIIDRVEDIISNGYKVILFTKFKTCAELIAEDIQKSLKANTLLYTGGQNDEEREKAISLFKELDDYNVLIGTEAMAEGLNLQVANYIINIDQPDTFAIKTQRIGRARRIGSNYNKVTVYDMITQSTDNAKSKDEERLENIAKNMDLTDALVSIDDAQRQALISAMSSQQN